MITNDHILILMKQNMKTNKYTYHDTVPSVDICSTLQNLLHLIAFLDIGAVVIMLLLNCLDFVQRVTPANVKWGLHRIHQCE